MKCLCKHCEKEYDDEQDNVWSINDDMQDQYFSCESCHLNGADDDIATQCESCGRWFYGEHLKTNPANGEQEICPYCGNVWLE